MPFDRKTFYDTIRAPLFDGSLSARQVVGINAKLDMWVKTSFTDLRWLAYILATSYHETGRAMYPVREGGEGAGHPYGVKLAQYGGQVAYGRGDVQLTWSTGYVAADAKLAALGLIKAGDLLANFDLALDPAISAAVEIHGMAEAWFTKFKLSDYLNETSADVLHCRRIVNGMDKAALIAGYYAHFYEAIVAATRVKADVSVTAAITSTLAQGAAIIASVPAAIGQAAAPIASTATSAVQAAVDAVIKTNVSTRPSVAPSLQGSVLPMDFISVFTSALSIYKTFGPMIPAVADAVPDLVTKTETLIADAKKMDVNASIADVEALVEAAEIPFHTITTTLEASKTLAVAG